MKNADQTMVKILSLVKDEHKELVEEKVKKATKEFLALPEDEQDDWFCGDGTIGYFFDDNHLDLFEDYEDGMQTILIDPENADDFIEFVCTYLDCYLD